MNEKNKEKIIYTTIFVILMGAGNFLALFWRNQQNEKILFVNSEPSQYTIFVDVEESKLYLLENGKTIKKYECSGGKWSTPSPIGEWIIIQKAKWGEGFGGSWLRHKCTMGTIWNTWHTR